MIGSSLQISGFSNGIEAFITGEDALTEVLAFGIEDAGQLVSVSAISKCADMHLKALHHTTQKLGQVGTKPRVIHHLTACQIESMHILPKR